MFTGFYFSKLTKVLLIHPRKVTLLVIISNFNVTAQFVTFLSVILDRDWSNRIGDRMKESKKTGTSPAVVHAYSYTPGFGSSFELRPLNYYRHPIFDNVSASAPEDLNHNLTAAPPSSPGYGRTRRSAVNTADYDPQVYLRCPGRPMPFRMLVLVAGLLQIDVAVFAIYFWMTGYDVYKYFPQFGPVLLDGSEIDGYAPCVWFGVEIFMGVWLMWNVWAKVSRRLYTLYLWTLLALTMTSVVHFCWSIPFKYEKYGFDVLGKFLIQFFFHLILVGVGREHYKQQYPVGFLPVVASA